MAQTTRTTTKTTTAKAGMRATRRDLDEDSRKSMVALLNHPLADATDLYSQTKHAHWNVRGMDFYQLHLLFDELAETRRPRAGEARHRAHAGALTAALAPARCVADALLHRWDDPRAHGTDHADDHEAEHEADERQGKHAHDAPRP